jgi:hypothetical protein
MSIYDVDDDYTNSIGKLLTINLKVYFALFGFQSILQHMQFENCKCLCSPFVQLVVVILGWQRWAGSATSNLGCIGLRRLLQQSKYANTIEASYHPSSIVYLSPSTRQPKSHAQRQRWKGRGKLMKRQLNAMSN